MWDFTTRFWLLAVADNHVLFAQHDWTEHWHRYNSFFLLDHRWSIHVQVQGTSAFVSSDFEHCISDQLALTVSPSFPAKRHGSKQASSFRIPEFLLQHHIITRLQPTETYDRCRYDLVKDTLMCFNTVFDVDLVCSAVWKSLARRAPS